MRTLVDIPIDDISWLDERARAEGKSRTAVVREAVSSFRAEKAGDDAETRLANLRAGFGAWKGRTDSVDSVEYLRRERAAETRHWDDDYELVRAGFPDLFDAEDDRQRRLYLEQRARR